MNTIVHYLRTGRKLRASGTVVTTDAGLTKVKPIRDGWGHVWLTQAEMEAGREKPEYRPRENKTAPEDRPKRVKKPKPAPVPRWRQLVEEVRIAATYGDQFVPVQLAINLADELQSARRQLAELLPLQLP